eukprot:Gb_29034 [translate_table: standard]
MLPFASPLTMRKIHNAERKTLMTCAIVLSLGKLLYSLESMIWPHVRCEESFRYHIQIGGSLCDELRNNSEMLPISTTFSVEKPIASMDGRGMCISSSIGQQSLPQNPISYDIESPSLLPGLPNDVAKHCLALVPRIRFQSLGSVCKAWRSFIQSKEFYIVRKLAGVLEEWLYVLTSDSENKTIHWQVLNSVNDKWQSLPPMPGPAKTAFGLVVIDAKLLVIAGLIGDYSGTARVSADVYEYDSALNRWSILAKMKVARYNFACAVVDALVYAVGGYGEGGESLSSVEVFDPTKNEWNLIESLRRPRWGCFACGLQGKLYVMGGRSSFRIGNSRSIDLYNPETHTWGEMKNGCVMVVAHAVLDKQLFCMEWKNERKLVVFSAPDNSWKSVPLPLTGALTVGFCFGILKRSLLLFSTKQEPFYTTLVYNPNAVPGSEWQITDIRPQGTCISSVTISA